MDMIGWWEAEDQPNRYISLTYYTFSMNKGNKVDLVLVDGILNFLQKEFC